MVVSQSPTIDLMGRNEQIMATLSTSTMQRLLLAHFRITRAAAVQAELVIVDGNDPNAFVGLMNQRHVIAINIALLKLIEDDIDEFAALIGHEAAHLAKGHAEAGKTRTTTLQGMDTITIP